MIPALTSMLGSVGTLIPILSSLSKLTQGGQQNVVPQFVKPRVGGKRGI